MLNATHPDDERLSALASRDADAAADASLTEHLTGCSRCSTTVAELTALRASLADLPDLRPSRPLQLLPPAIGDASPDGVGTWVRRLFRPLMTAGAALAIVGVVGTTLPASMGSLFQNVGSEMRDGGAAAEEDHSQIETLASGEAAPAAGVDRGSPDEPAEAQRLAERSPWPMILFTGVALMIGAALLRWILVPRAG